MAVSPRFAGASWDNPLRHIATLATPEDYVLFKLDIDNVVVEEGIVRSLLADPALLALVDEFYWEHHVNFRPMNAAWRTSQDSKYMNASIPVFARLREVGIRAHSWT